MSGPSNGEQFRTEPIRRLPEGYEETLSTLRTMSETDFRTLWVALIVELVTLESISVRQLCALLNTAKLRYKSTGDPMHDNRLDLCEHCGLYLKRRDSSRCKACAIKALREHRCACGARCSPRATQCDRCYKARRKLDAQTRCVCPRCGGYKHKDSRTCSTCYAARVSSEP